MSTKVGLMRRFVVLGIVALTLTACGETTPESAAPAPDPGC
jgi:hypothetical protein